MAGIGGGGEGARAGAGGEEARAGTRVVVGEGARALTGEGAGGAGGGGGGGGAQAGTGNCFAGCWTNHKATWEKPVRSHKHGLRHTPTARSLYILLAALQACWLCVVCGVWGSE